MADGEARPEDSPVIETDDQRPTDADGQVHNRWQSLINWRQTPFLIWAALAAIVLTAIVFWHTFSTQHVLETTESKLWFLSATLFFWLPLVLLLRDSQDNFAHGPSPRLPLACVGLLIVLTAAVMSVHWLLPNQPGAGEAGFFGLPVIACVFSALALVFIPLGWNAANLSRYQLEERRKVSARTANIHATNEAKDAEAMGALVATILVGSIIGFAICAGIWNDRFSFDNLIGVVIGFLVVGAFAIVVFMEPLSETLPVKWLGRVFGSSARAARPLAAFYDLIDTFLVRIVAVVTGMEHRSVAARYSILGTMLTCLCLLGWYLPPAWGLLPCALGILAAISVSRLWSWVEDDRALAALTDFKPTTPYRTSMREDYRDETLLGFLFVFFLIPVMMRDAHWSRLFGDDMFTLPKGERTTFFDWFGYFGITLAKAVPIVDWAEIYNFGQPKAGAPGSLITMRSVASQHAVFMARSTVDLVLIASLLQAINISGRNRQQKRLFRAGIDRANKYRPGLIDRLDTFVEKTELQRAAMAALNRKAPGPNKDTTAREAHDLHFDLKVLSKPALVDFRRYNSDRLGQMHGEYKDPVARAFIAAIAYERPDFDLTPRLILLDGMAEREAPESELYILLDRIETDLVENPSSVNLTIEALRSILFHTAKRAGLREFKLRIIALMITCGPAEEVIEALADVAGRSNPDAYQYTKVAAVEAIDQVARRLQSEQSVRATIAILKEIQRYDPGIMTEQKIRHVIPPLRTLAKSLKR